MIKIKKILFACSLIACFFCLSGKELFEVLWTDWLEHHLLTLVLGTPVAELDYDMLYEILPSEKKEAFAVEKQNFWKASLGV